MAVRSNLSLIALSFAGWLHQLRREGHTAQAQAEGLIALAAVKDTDEAAFYGVRTLASTALRVRGSR